MTYYNFNKLRQIDLSIVLTILFNAIEVGTKASHNTRQYLLPTKQKIAITGLKWFDNSACFGGVGAIDLVMHIKSVSLYEAAKILEMFSGDQTTTYNNVLIKTQSVAPEPCTFTWNCVKSYLTNVRKIPETIINELYNNKLLWSDKRRNCVFPRDLNTGAYVRGTIPGIPFKMSIGRNGRPYLIPGDNLLIITEAPIDAVSLKHYFPNATMVATGGRIGFDKIEPYIIKAERIFLAHDNDKAGEEQATSIRKAISINTERLLPLYNLKDWNEVLQFESKNHLNQFSHKVIT
jgi:hypothetical protein